MKPECLAANKLIPDKTQNISYLIKRFASYV